MDIARPASYAQHKRMQRLAAVGGGVFLVLAATLGLSRLRPAAPTVDRSTLWVDVVKRGDMLRQVRGIGTLVPEEIRWIPAASEGRVERVVVQPGTPVTADRVILELSNPEVVQAALQSDADLRAAEAQLTELKVRLQNQRLDLQASVARVEAEAVQAEMQAEADRQLAQDGLVAAITLKTSESRAAETGKRLAIERERLAISGGSVSAQLAVQQAAVEQRRAMARLRRDQLEGLKVRAGMDGVLQQVPVEVGQRVAPGTNLARVAQPGRLKAVVKVAETQARDIVLGQKADVDTRNGLVAGHVSRIDPAAQGGTVTVDIALDGALPRGARPDLTVDGTIELEHLTNVLHVGRPAQDPGTGPVGLFVVEPGTGEALRRKVRLGRSSVNSVEVLDGLKEGDQVVLSDTSAWDAVDRIRLN